jgi:hypothetical protein
MSAWAAAPLTIRRSRTSETISRARLVIPLLGDLVIGRALGKPRKDALSPLQLGIRRQPAPGGFAV